jgi:hypothetical protein
MGVIDLYFVNNVVECLFVDEIQPIAPKPLVYQLVLYHWLQFPIFLLSTSFYRVRNSAPDGSSPRGYSRIFSGIGSKI